MPQMNGVSYLQVSERQACLSKSLEDLEFRQASCQIRTSILLDFIFLVIDVLHLNIAVEHFTIQAISFHDSLVD